MYFIKLYNARGPESQVILPLICQINANGWFLHTDSFIDLPVLHAYVVLNRSSQTTSDLPLKGAGNGSTGADLSSLPAVTETFALKDRLDVKSPQLPFGENVAVATSPVGAQ